jgi:hypothetical protein
MHAELNVEEIARAYSLTRQDSITGVLRTYCKGTTIQHFSENVSLNGSDLNLELTIPAFQWADQADLKFSIIHNAVDTSTLTPGKAVLNKSRLYEQTWSLVLSGSYSRSDVQSVTFVSGDGKNNALWEISITPPVEIGSWSTVEQSAVVHIRVNQARETDLEISQVELLLKVDMIMASLEAIFDHAITADARDEIIEMILAPPLGSGSWLRFLSLMFPIAFPNGGIAASQFWHSHKDEIRARIQSYIGGLP